MTWNNGDYKSASEVVDSFDEKTLLTLIYSSISSCERSISPTDSADYVICMMKNFCDDYRVHKDQKSKDVLDQILKFSKTPKFELELRKNSKNSAGDPRLYSASLNLAEMLVKLEDQGRYACAIPGAVRRFSRAKPRFSKMAQDHSLERMGRMRDLNNQHTQQARSLESRKDSVPEAEYVLLEKELNADFARRLEKKQKKLRREQFAEEARQFSYVLESVLRQVKGIPDIYVKQKRVMRDGKGKG